MILSGLLVEEAGPFEDALESRGFSLVERETMGVWWAGTAVRAAGEPARSDRRK